MIKMENSKNTENSLFEMYVTSCCFACYILFYMIIFCTGHFVMEPLNTVLSTWFASFYL